MERNLLGEVIDQTISHVVEEATSFRMDGWSNVISGLGTAYDKRTHTKWTASGNALDSYTLSGMYAQDGLIQRIVNAFPDDMTREWINIPDDNRDSEKDEGEIEKQLRLLGAQKAFNTALRWARLMGGSLIFIGAMDGRKPSEELNVKKIKSVEFLRVFDLNEIDTAGSVFESDPSKKEYGRIVKYSIRPKRSFGTFVPQNQQIHHTRCLPFHGMEVPLSTPSIDMIQRYWGVSAIVPVYEYLRDFVGVMGSVSQILYEFVVGKYKMADLDEMLAQGNEKALQVRIQAIEMTKSIIRAVLLGTDEDYTRDSASLSGIPDTIDRFMMMLSSVTEIPVTRLFGRSPAGLNATGENDLKNYYDVVKSKQQNDLTPGVGTLIQLLVSAESGSVEPPEFVWNPLMQLSEKDMRENNRLEAEAYRTRSNANQMYIQEGVLTPEEVYKMEFEKKLGKKNPEEFEDLPEAQPNPLVPNLTDPNSNTVVVDPNKEEEEEEEDQATK